MSDILYKAQDLINNNKAKKAQIILNKLNRKSPSYGSLDLEAYCFFLSEKFGLAIPRYQQALKFNPPTNDKKNILQNLAACQLKLDQKQLALNTLQEALVIDNSVNNAECRMKIGQITTELGQHALTLEYLPKLLNLSQYATEALLFLINASILVGDNNKTQLYTNKLLAECPFYSSAESVNFLSMFIQRDNSKLAKKMMAVLAPKHSHEQWFTDFSKEFTENNLTHNNIPTPPNKRVIGKNKKLITLVNALLADNEQQGAVFHESVRIFEQDGNLSIKAFIDNQDNEKLLNIPLSCMPLLSDYTLDLNSKMHIIATPIMNMKNPTANNTMQLLVSIYNQTDKIKSWQQTCPFIALQTQPELLAKLVSGKKYTQKVTNFFQLALDKNNKKLTLDSFFGSRTFTYTKELLIEAGININAASELGLLSIIDFLNHKVHATKYHTEYGSLHVAGKAVATNQELFVHYNNFDPLLTYLIYGFVDTNAPWLFNVPMKITCSNGVKIDILGNAGQTDANSYSKSGDFLAEYLPNITTITATHYGVDKLVIPSKQHNNLLREALTVLIKSIDKGNYFNTDQQFNDEVLLLEQQIISQNLTYWRELETLNKDKNTEVELLTTTAKQHISNYANGLGISLF